MAKMKTEEEKSEEKFLKKEKKLKNGKAPLHKNGTVNNGSLTERTKAKKSKKPDVVCVDLEEESCDVKNKKKKIKKQPECLSDEKSHVKSANDKEDSKKIKKKTTFTESLNDSSGSNVKSENGIEVKKKKKKKQLAEDREEIAQTVVIEEDGSKKERKEKKIKKRSVQIQSEKLKIEKEEEEEEQQARKDELPKKAKKRKNNVLVVSTEEPEEQIIQKKKKKTTNTTTSEESSDAVDEKRKTKKSKKVNRNVCENQTKSDTETGEVEELKRKKKRAKNLLEKGVNEQENDVGSLEIKDNTLKKKKSEIAIMDEGETVLNTEGKKKARRASAEVTEVEEKEPAKKKNKRKTQQQEEEEPPLVKCEQVEEQNGQSLVNVVEETRQKRKKKSVNLENVSFETGTKKKKKKKMIKEEGEEQNASSQVDLLFLSEKYGNIDEVTINQERRKALQIEVDQASRPEKTAKPTGFGQWGTAQFNTSEQQQKFLRLMGGFKKGFQPAAGNTEKANMALGKNAQQQLQQGLLGEFERAHSRRMDTRGAGLGFTPPSNKKFFIDINTSRSIRFDD